MEIILGPLHFAYEALLYKVVVGPIARHIWANHNKIVGRPLRSSLSFIFKKKVTLYWMGHHRLAKCVVSKHIHSTSLSIRLASIICLWDWNLSLSTSYSFYWLKGLAEAYFGHFIARLFSHFEELLHKWILFGNAPHIGGHFHHLSSDVWYNHFL